MSVDGLTVNGYPDFAYRVVNEKALRGCRGALNKKGAQIDLSFIGFSI